MLITTSQVNILVNQSGTIISDFWPLILLLLAIPFAFYIVKSLLIAALGAERYATKYHSLDDEENDEDIPPEDKEAFRKEHLHDFD